MLLQALIDELVGKGLVNRAAILERVEKLRNQTRALPEALTAPATADVYGDQAKLLYISLDDLVRTNRIGIETLVSILCDKGFLANDEVAELLADLRKKTPRNYAETRLMRTRISVSAARGARVNSHPWFWFSSPR
jgi:hypothetical protein